MCVAWGTGRTSPRQASFTERQTFKRGLNSLNWVKEKIFLAEEVQHTPGIDNGRERKKKFGGTNTFWGGKEKHHKDAIVKGSQPDGKTLVQTVSLKSSIRNISSSEKMGAVSRGTGVLFAASMWSKEQHRVPNKNSPEMKRERCPYVGVKAATGGGKRNKDDRKRENKSMKRAPLLSGENNKQKKPI